MEILPDAIKITLIQHNHSGVQSSRTPLSTGMEPAIGMALAIGMAQSPHSGNPLLALHLRPLRCCGCGRSHRIIMDRYIAQRKLPSYIIFLSLVKACPV